MSSVKCVLAVAIIASVACSVFAIQCYDCNSTSNPKCGRKFVAEPSMKVVCPTEVTACYKTSTADRNEFFEHRGCYPHNFTEPPKFQREIDLYLCQKDLCNSSTANGPVAAVFLMTFYAFARIFA